MAKLYRNVVLVIAVLILFTWAIVPPEKKLRLGKDLSGGVSLIYQLQIGPDEDAKQIQNDTRRVLMDRIDPSGVMEIAMVPLGRDRLEITMPLPSDEVKALRAAFEAEIEELGRTSISRRQLIDLESLSGDARAKKFAELGKGNAARAAALAKVAELSDRASALRAELEAMRGASADGTEIDAKAAEIAQTEIDLDAARADVIKTVLPASEVRTALELSATRKKIYDESTKQYVEIESARDLALSRIREQYPDATAQLDKVLAAYTTYEQNRKTLDDPNDLKRLVRSAGVLTFRITVQPGALPDEARLRQELRELGPRNVRSSEARWFKINNLETWYNDLADIQRLKDNPRDFFGRMNYVAEEYQGQYYILAWDTRGTRLTPAEGEWGVSRAFEDRDQTGRPAIGFRMNPRGAVLLGELTKNHVGEQMAILLDDEIYTAPRLNSAISGSGIIEGDFPVSERQYVIKVLSGGSLQAKISPEPISTNSIGPELGADNLRAGLLAGVLALVFTAGFMVVYYFGCGLIAVIALACNAVLIMGAMSLNSAAFTMPGIAGVILTFGMAVDSNVLIYERMREEYLRGNDMKTMVRLGFSKALSSIVDGNVTNLIVCVVLAYTGTQEIKGFAITMGIGVLSTLFSALVISRLLFDVMVYVGGWRKISMLPLAVPAVQRALTPNINWLRYRYVFFTISALYVGLGLTMIGYQGSEMLDNEFRGGTAVTLDFKPLAPGSSERATLTRAEVEERVHKIAAESPASEEQLKLLMSAEIMPINPRNDGVTSDRFTIKTVATDKDRVTEAVTAAFGDVLETQPALAFVGSEARAGEGAPVYRIINGELAASIGRAAAGAPSVAPYIGGAAIVLDNIAPPISLEALTQRLETMRGGPEFADTLTRQRQIVVLDGDESAVKSAALLVRDDASSFFDNADRWTSDVAAREWTLVREALTVAQTPASVTQFSPQIADSFRAQAIVATVLSFLLITIYVWVRFKGLRFSVAALVALVHDVLTVVGLVALCEILYGFQATEGFARSIGLLPFKIDLNMVAALLTIAGYSLNDTIVIMDRIREVKGKAQHANAEMINLAINQTISRTVITGGTTMVSLIILYLVGGEGVRSFSFALFVGLIVGTYSSVAVAAPLVWSRKHEAETGEQPVSGGVVGGVV